MSTQLRDVGLMVEVSTFTGVGGRKKMSRRAVLVDMNDKEAIKAEIIKQAIQARVDVGIKPKPPTPVV